MNRYDIAIIGTGPAGVSAAITAKVRNKKILLFGSQAKGTATAKSDIDLCIIASTNDKRSLLTDLYCDTESDTPIDFLLYTPEEWERSVADSQSFAHKLNREGVVLYG